MKCRDCKLFNIEAAKNKAGRIMKAWAVQCFWKSKEAYPVSVADNYRPHASYVTADYGEGCQCFQKRVPS